MRFFLGPVTMGRAVCSKILSLSVCSSLHHSKTDVQLAHKQKRGQLEIINIHGGVAHFYQLIGLGVGLVFDWSLTAYSRYAVFTGK